MTTAVHSSSASSSTYQRSLASRDGSSGAEYLYRHKRSGSNGMQPPIARYPKTQPPSSPPPSIPTYEYQVLLTFSSVRFGMNDFKWYILTLGAGACWWDSVSV